MDCQTAQSLIQKYIARTLTMDELDAFIRHVKSCPECYDELKTYFIVSTALQHLDADQDGDLPEMMDMSRLLDMDLKGREGNLRRWRLKKNLVFFLICLFLCLLIVLAVWMFT